jgi:hypothetical protein
MRSITADERRARLAWRHRLAAEARVDDDLPAIADDVVAFHATDPATAVLSALARMRSPSISAVQAALYDDRTLLRMLAMRRTMFTCSLEAAPVLQSACGDAVAAAERKRLVAMVEGAGLTDDAASWLPPIEAETLAALEELGEPMLAAELSKVVPALALQIRMAVGKAYEGKASMSSRVLFLLAAEGRLARARPRGDWTSGQHRWTPMTAWLGAPLERLDETDASRELVRRWLARFGPGTVADLKWWTGWTLGKVRTAIAGLDTEEVELDGEVGLVLSGDVDEVAPPEPWAALLPSLDPASMGWNGRDWYLSEHGPQVFDRNGNAGATVWVDGRIVGAWAVRKATGEVVTHLLEDVGSEAEAAVDAAAERLHGALENSVVTPRFPGPLDRGLAAS